MNYRHAFHAGSFADVMKHALLARMLAYLQRKAAPFRAIDTHAGVGLYDLSGDEARRTGEWRDGVGRMAPPFGAEVEEILAPYRRALGVTRARHGDAIYPGSPALLREMLRRCDRGVLVERHDADHAALSARYHAVANLKVLHLDGFLALHALIPPKEKRGLVLIDPPFEQPDELERLGSELLRALRKWPTGAYAAWYPIKDPAAVEAVAQILDREARRPGLRLELLVDRTGDPSRLAGCGLFVMNPPFTLQGDAEILLPALAERLARTTYGGYRCQRLGAPA